MFVLELIEYCRSAGGCGLCDFFCVCRENEQRRGGLVVIRRI